MRGQHLGQRPFKRRSRIPCRVAAGISGQHFLKVRLGCAASARGCSGACRTPFPEEIREQFAVLAFDHFRHASRFGEKSIQVLQWAVEQGDTLGRPASVDAMMARFAIPDPGMPEPPPGIEEGPAGMFRQIYQTVSQQAQASKFWIDHGGLSPEILVHVKTYYWAACQIAEILGEVRK